MTLLNISSYFNHSGSSSRDTPAWVLILILLIVGIGFYFLVKMNMKNTKRKKKTNEQIKKMIKNRKHRPR